MGNKQSSSSKFHPPTDQHQLQILYQCEQGQVVQSTLNQKQYLIRQLSFGNSQSMQEVLHQLKQYENENKSGMLINLLNIQKRSYKNMCGSQNRVRLIFEYSMVSINDEIEERKPKCQYFDLSDCYRIMVGSFRAIQQVQNQYNKYPKLVQNSILNRVFTQPQRILLMQNGLVKLINPLIVSSYDRFQHRHNSYYSPQKLSDFDFAQDSKSMIFQLGISLMHIFLLRDCKDIYNGFEVKQDTIDSRILQIWNIYSDVLLCEMLNRMTRTYRNARADLQEGIGMVAMLQERLMSRLAKELAVSNRACQIRIQDDTNQMQDQAHRQYNNRNIKSKHEYCISTYSTYSNKYTNNQSNIKSNNNANVNNNKGDNEQKNVSLCQFDVQVLRNKAAEKNTNSILESSWNNIRLPNHSKYARTYKKQTNSLCIFQNSCNLNMNLLDNTKKDIEIPNLKNNIYNAQVYPWGDHPQSNACNQNKQNIMKYCNTISIIPNIPNTTKSTSQPSPINARPLPSQQYRHISNYYYMHDHQLQHIPDTSHQQIGMGIMDEFTDYQNNQDAYIKQTESIIRYKQSYQYGQQLTEGLYTKQTNTNTSKNNKNTSNFEWKRTQFNKKNYKNIQNHSISRKSRNSYYISNPRENTSNIYNLSHNLATSKYINTSDLDINCQDFNKSEQSDV